MPHLHIPSLGSAKDHPRLGCPTWRGYTLADVSEASAGFFRGAGVLRATLDGKAATAGIVEEITASTAEIDRAQALVEVALTQAGKLIEEAKRLADLPVVGNERRVVEGFAATVAAAIEQAAVGHDALAALDHLRACLPLAHGLDVAAINGAVGQFDAARDRYTLGVVQLKASHAQLIELAMSCDDAPAREKVGKIKLAVDRQRRIPAVLVELEAIRDQTTGILARVDAALSSLREVA